LPAGFFILYAKPKIKSAKIQISSQFIETKFQAVYDITQALSLENFSKINTQAKFVFAI